MAQNKFALARYQLIHRSLKRGTYVKTALLVELCNDILDYNVSRRTIQMDIEAMRNDPFLGYYAPIEYCTRHKAYYYTRDDFDLTKSTFSLSEFGVLCRVCEKLKGHLPTEDYAVLLNILRR